MNAPPNMSLPDPQNFLTQLFAALEKVPGQFDGFELDHLCYRVGDWEEYVALRDALLLENELLTESQIGGRPIAVFRLSDPITFRGRSIEVLELPAPKPGSAYPSGYEHVEFVIDTPLADFEWRLTDHLGFPATYIDRKGLNKSINPDLRLRLPDGLSVKFHEQSLADVIAFERGQQSGEA
ncbi:VOC family protein [Lewinella sp. 4G2]|uniref:VOC family protein n=1 Tax=Lewinella sp. 4G2 TaxID=1803372 RepID=UPI0007B46D6D|nr:VOC family protein [Lewinella sp. 4G2]OAV44788.1 hypothetical protein A3850_009935 [Lewinella sp. 4G2]